MTRNERKQPDSLILVREKVVEDYLVKQSEAHGALCEKYICPGRRGVPDRVISWRHPIVDFAECKKPKGGRVSVLQRLDHAARRALGHEVKLIRTFEQVDDYIESRRPYWAK